MGGGAGSWMGWGWHGRGTFEFGLAGKNWDLGGLLLTLHDMHLDGGGCGMCTLC